MKILMERAVKILDWFKRCGGRQEHASDGTMVTLKPFWFHHHHGHGEEPFQTKECSVPELMVRWVCCRCGDTYWQRPQFD